MESVLVPIVVIALLAVVVWVVGQPLRRGSREEVSPEAGERAELEAEKEAKYREIRDAELDHLTGKLDTADWRAVDRQLRAEAVQLLRRIDALGPADGDDESAGR